MGLNEWGGRKGVREALSKVNQLADLPRGNRLYQHSRSGRLLIADIRFGPILPLTCRADCLWELLESWTNTNLYQTIKGEYNMKYEVEECSPGVSLAESLRSFGYDLQTALADLVDNSISAGAKRIDLDFEWNGDESRILLLDDGFGMDELTLVEAMRPGTTSPRDERKSTDLGRFGLGLKTASFSQARKFTVYTKPKKKDLFWRCWDLDFIEQKEKWLLLRGDSVFIQEDAEKLSNQKSGTLVVWDKLDRVVGDISEASSRDKKYFMNCAEDTKGHLAMTFHRFMESPKGLTIYLNGRKIKPWNPFVKHSATQMETEEPIIYKNQRITVTPYILPHHSKFATKEEYNDASGIKGWNAHQGFYVYRNKRLLVAGDWLGVGGQQEEHAKLARIQLDIPNELDDAWKLDVKKSKAVPVAALRPFLSGIARRVRGKATNIYRHRGKIVQRDIESVSTFVWQEKRARGKTRYSVNLKHPSLLSLMETLSVGQKKEFRNVLKLMEETIPLPVIVLSNSESPDSFVPPFDGEVGSKLYPIAESLYEGFIGEGLSHGEAITRACSCEPFNLYSEIVALLEEKFGVKR